ncbi:MAG: PAS domain S-box protein [Dehalococcoidia bacterium]
MSVFDRWRPDRPDSPSSLAEADRNGAAHPGPGSSEDPEAWYQQLVELSPDGIVLHQDGCVVYANQAALDMAGIPAGVDVVGARIFDVLDADTQQQLMAAADGDPPDRPGTLRINLKRRDGATVPVEVISAPVIHRGRPATQSMMRDISALVERERWLNLQSRSAEVMARLNGRLLTVETRRELLVVAEDAARTLLEAESATLLGRTEAGSYVHYYGNAFAPDVVEVFCEVAASHLPTLESEPYVAETLEAVGLSAAQQATLERAGVGSFMMAPTRMVSIAHGVTVVTFDRAGHPGLANIDGFQLMLNALYLTAQRVASMEETRQSDERFRDAVEANASGFAILAPVLDDNGTMVDAEYLFANSSMHEMLERFCGNPQVKLYSHAYPDPSHFTAGMERFRTALRRMEPTESIAREDYPNGSERWVRRRVAPTGQGNLTVTVRDITPDIRAQRAADDAEERFKATAESNVGAFFILQPVRSGDGPVTGYTVGFANQAARHSFLRNAPDEDAGLIDIVGRDALAETLEACNQVLGTGQPVDDVVRHPQLQPSVPGHTWYRRRIAAQGDRLFVTFEDVTEERRRDAESRRNFELLRAAADSNQDTFLLLEPVRDGAGQITDFSVIFQNRRALETRVPNPNPSPATLREILFYDDGHFEKVLAEFVEAFESGEPSIKDVAWDYAGTVTWFERHLSVTADVLTVVYRDITSFRREIADLGAAEADRRAVLEGLSDMIVVADRDSEGSYRVSYANEAFRRAFGDYSGRKIVEAASHFDPRALEQMTAARIEAVRTGSTRGFSFEGLIDGERRAVNLAVTPVLNGDDELVRTIWRLTDVTEQKESARRLVAAAEANPDAFLIMEPVLDQADEIANFRIVFENEGARAIRRAFSGREDVQLLSDMVGHRPDQFSRVLQDYVSAFQEGRTTDQDLAVGDPLGNQRHYHRRLMPMPGCLVVTYRETTAGVNQMQAIEAAEREKQAILDSLSDLICVSEPDAAGEFVITYANRAYLTFMGLTADEVLGRPRREFQAPELHEMYEDVRRTAIENRAPVNRELTAMLNGERRHANVLVTPFFDDDGACILTIWRITDLSEQRAAEGERDRAIRQQSVILDDISDLIYVFERDEEGDFRITYGNVAAHNAYGERGIGKRFDEFLDPGEAEICAALLQRVSESGRPEAIERSRVEGGAQQWLSISASPVLDPDGRCQRVIWRVSDVTSLRAGQARIEANQRFHDAILQSLSDLIYVLDRDPDGEFRYTYLNRSAQQSNENFATVKDWMGQRVDDVMAPEEAAVRHQMFDRALRTGESVAGEVSRRLATGSIGWANVVVVPVLNSDGSCDRIIYRATDITRSRAHQVAIEENERNWRAILDAMPDVLIVMDRPAVEDDFRVSYVNAARGALTGRPDEQLVEKTFDEFLPPEGAERLRSAVESAITERRLVDFEGDTPDASGVPLTYAARITPVYDEDDVCRRIILRYTDVTSTRRIERQLEQSERDRAIIVESLADIILLFDRDDAGDYRLSFANPPFFATGRTREETMGKRFRDFLQPDEAAAREEMLARAIATKMPVECEVNTYFGDRAFHYMTRVLPIFEGERCVRTVWRYTDISELVRNRERLEANEAEHRAVLDGLSDAVFMVDIGPDDRWTIAGTNRANLVFTGLDREELQGKTLERLARLDSNAAMSLHAVREAAASGEIVEEESPAVYAGTDITVVRRVTPLLDDEGKVYRCIVRVSDVTEVRRREATINRLGRAMDGSSDEVLIIDAGTMTILQTNAGARENLGYSDDELVGMPVWRLLPEENAESIEDLIAPLRNGETHRLNIDGNLRRKDGTTYPVETRVQLLEHDESPVYVAIVRDVSERRVLEQALARLAAIVESSADAVMSIDADGTVGHWNQAAESLFGVPEVEAVGSTLADLFTDEADTELLHELAENGGTSDAVLHLSNGSQIDVSLSAFVVRGNDGRELGKALFARDNRWRVEATQALSESERRFRSIFDQAPEGILIQRASDGVILDINQRLLEMIELPRNVMLGKQPIDLGVVVDTGVVMDLDRSLAEGGRALTAPHQLRLRSGTGQVVETLVSAQMIELNGEQCFLSFLSDVTQLRQVERDLLRAEASLRSVTQNLPIILTSWDAEERCTLATGLGLTLAGLDGDSLIGHSMRDIVGPSAQLEHALETAGPGDTGTIEVSLGGRIFEAQFRVLPDGSSVSVAVDVTDMRTTSRQIDAIVEHMPITFLAFDADGLVTFCRGATDLAVTEQSIGQSIIDLYANTETVVTDIRRVLSGERVSSVYSRDDGRSHEVHYNPVRTADGNLAGAAVVIIDITERLQAERAVAESNERFRQMAETATDGIVSANRRGRIVFANDAMNTIFGYGPEELVGQPLTMLMPHALASSHRMAFQRYQETREKHLSWQSLELTGRRKDGTEFTLEMAMSEGTHAGEPVVTAFIRDITERRRTEEALMQAQKLESLGVLAGGIAHDFNNMLVAIMGNAGLALSELQAEAPAYETVQEIELAARRAAELARQMLAYSGKGRLAVNTVDLTTLVEEIPHLLRTSIGKGVTLRYDLTRDIPAVEADPTQLRQVVMNLVINASDAIGQEEGVISVATGVVDADREYLRSVYIPGDPKPGRYCYLEVRDSGSGMSQETLAKIFDPFFTTKFTGKGLGLAAVLGIVRGHKGTIKVESAPGQGTTFRLLLPAADEAVEGTTVKARTEAGWQGMGIVLVVDDEDSVRHVTGRALKTMGFEVIDAEDGQAGLELFKARHQDIACVLMDLTMPRMNGETAALQMKEIDPSVPIVLMSGFDEGEMATRFRDAGMAAFVQKPFEIRTLREAMRQATDHQAD